MDSLSTHAEALTEAYPTATEQAWRFSLRRLLSLPDVRTDAMWLLLGTLGTAGIRARSWLTRERQVLATVAAASLPLGVTALCTCGRFHDVHCAPRTSIGQ